MASDYRDGGGWGGEVAQKINLQQGAEGCGKTFGCYRFK
jgi:hypothetical protein